MVKNVTVINKCTRDIRITEVHANCNTRIWATAAPSRNGKSILQFRVGDRHTVYCLHQGMELVDVKRVRFPGVVLDRPVFN
jgi:hypothetical protein